MVRPLEAVADAIMKHEGWAPGTRSYNNRNPGNLRGGRATDDKGFNVYATLVQGYQDLVNDLFDKFTGNNHHQLNQESTLLQLMNIYAPAADSNDPTAYATFIAQFVSKVLNKPISATSKLSEVYSVQVSTTLGGR